MIPYPIFQLLNLFFIYFAHLSANN
jgi:hypothetical protein